MQIDLFKDRAVMAEAAKKSGRLEARGFQLCHDLEGLDKVIGCGEAQSYYKQKMKELSRKPRMYSHVGGVGCDNLFELELLGVGKYAKEYTVVLDFSERLDYVLHCMYGCPTRDVRRMPGYLEVSKALLNYRIDDMPEINFSALFSLSDKIVEDFNKSAENFSDCYSIEEQMSLTVFEFYQKLLFTVGNMKDYVMSVYTTRQPKNTFVYRSKSYAAAVATSSIQIEDVIVLKNEGVEDCEIPIKSYRTFEWAKEVIRCK